MQFGGDRQHVKDEREGSRAEGERRLVEFQDWGGDQARPKAEDAQA